MTWYGHMNMKLIFVIVAYKKSGLEFQIKIESSR